jgi:transglutaminase-like putative cysteine protease
MGLTLSFRESIVAICLVAAVSWLPAWSIALAGWSENLEPVPWFAAAGVVAGWALARVRWRQLVVHAVGILAGLAAAALVYSTFLEGGSYIDRFHALLARVGQWLSAWISGGYSTDNLLFAFSMAILAWGMGYLGAWSVFRWLLPWLAVVPTASVLLLNLSLSPPELLPLLYLYLFATFLLLMQLTSLRHVATWRVDRIASGLNQGATFAVGGAALGVGMLFLAWSLPTGEVSRAVSSAWETVAGPWQDTQATFDRLFASLNPAPPSARGLTAMQSLAPRGSFELGDNPVYRVTGKQPAYWRAATYDRYTGQLMTSSTVTPVRRDRRQPLVESMDAGEGRKFTEYSFFVLAPGTSVIHAPDAPLTISVPSAYEYRGDVSDFAFLRPSVALHQFQQYSVLSAVSTASMSELRRAGTIYPQSTRSYLQLPDGFPDAVRDEAWRVVGNAETTFDAASNIETYLRTLTYKTRVAVPPPGRDWVSFLLFDSKEGYCDYYATAMTVMLRAVGIPARVATGYVTGEWDPGSQSYLVNENHAHTWTEVFFPGYGWITFEPSANRALPPRSENPLVAETEEEQQRLLENEGAAPDFLDEEELEEDGNFVPLPDSGGSGGPSIPLLILLGLGIVGLGALAVGPGIWIREIGRAPAFARPYAQTVRLATWLGIGPRPSQTPYEYTSDLARALPEAADALHTVGNVYVEGLYGRKEPDAPGMERVRIAGSSTLRRMLSSLGGDRWEQVVGSRLKRLVGGRDEH